MGDIKFQTEVVINTTFGGYALSEQAIQLVKERKNLFGMKIFEMTNGYVSKLPRNDEILVGVVKELGDAAGGRGCKLKVVKVDLTVEVRNHDGQETVYVDGGEF